MPESLCSPVHAQSANSQTQAPSCAVLVMSCDAYRDLWRPFFTIFWRFWADCPFAVYLGSNGAKHDDPRVITIPAGDHEWSKRARLCLEQISDDYVLLLLEDYFLTAPVSNATISEHLNLLHALGGIVLRLYPLPGPDREIREHTAIGHIHRRAPYRVSTQAAIWNRAELLKMLLDDESIWEFERKGTRRSEEKTDGFYASYKSALDYRQVVERGQWFRSAAKYYKQQQIGCDFEARPVMSALTSLRKFVNGKRRYWIGRFLSLRFRRPLWQ